MRWNGAGLSPEWYHCTGHGSAPRRTTARGRIHITGHGSAPGRITAALPTQQNAPAARSAPRHPGGSRPPRPPGREKRWDSRSPARPPARPRRTDSAARGPPRTGPPLRARTGLCGRWGWRGERRLRGNGAGNAERGARRPQARPAGLPAPAPATAPRTPRRKCGPGRGGLTATSANRRARPRPAVVKTTNQLPRRSPGRRGGC